MSGGNERSSSVFLSREALNPTFQVFILQRATFERDLDPLGRCIVLDLGTISTMKSLSRTLMMRESICPERRGHALE